MADAAVRMGGNGCCHTLTNLPLRWPDPTALGALMEMKGEASAALGAKTAAGAQGAL